MKNLLPLLMIMLAAGSYSSALAQDKFACSLKAEFDAPLVRAHLKSAFADVLAKTDTRFELHQFLMKDKTDEMPYVSSVADEKTWFVCNHFANQLFLRASALVKAEDYAVLEQKTPIRFSEARSSTAQRLPLFTLNITNYSTQFYHTVNALYLGDAKGELSDLSSYLFIEPQNDGIFLSVDQLIKHYFGPNNLDQIEISVTLPDPVGFDYQGGIQYHSSPVATFDCSVKDKETSPADTTSSQDAPSLVPLKAPSLLNTDLAKEPRAAATLSAKRAPQIPALNASTTLAPVGGELVIEDEAQLVIPDAVDEMPAVKSTLSLPKPENFSPPAHSLKPLAKEWTKSEPVLPQAPAVVEEDEKPVRKFFKKIFGFGRN